MDGTERYFTMKKVNNIPIIINWIITQSDC
jgi:hypothetical protein